MIRCLSLLLLVFTLMVGVVLAAAPTSRPVSSQPASAPAASAVVMKILNAQEAAGKKNPTIRANIKYSVDNLLTGDTEWRSGYVVYRKETLKASAKFRIHFETLKQGSKKSKTIRSRVDYAFDGQWLTVAKHRIRKLTRYQVAVKGQKVEPLRLGKGPFPLPFGQKTADVLKFFKVATRKSRKKDPKNTDYLKLTTRRNRRKEISFLKMEMWIDRSTHLPVKIVSRDKSKNITTVIFQNVQGGVKISKNIFQLPRQRGWKVIVKPLKKASPPVP